MKTIKLLFCIAASLLITIMTDAQPVLDQKPPMDPEIRTGRLENGLTYFIRKNNEPEKRVSFYIIQNVGAVLENDDQNGLAHFLEHMAFNGTKNFPGKGIISGLEKHGVAFGSNINAYTSYDETVYNITNVPVDKRPDLIDTCLLILNDWSDFISLDDKEIDLERGVILEEWRQGEDASSRMFNKIIVPVLLKDSKYAKRDVIGDPEVIKNFSYNTLRDFYYTWYRTDLQAIAVVGDLNVDEVEAKIKALFSKIPAVTDPPARYFPDVPDHKDTYFVLATDKEAPQTGVSVFMFHKSVPPEEKNLKYVRDSYVVSLMNSMISTRINELLQKGNPPFVAGSIYDGGYIAKKSDAFRIGVTARKNEEAIALEAIYTEAERAKRYGFGKGELDRAKARTLSGLENAQKQKDKISNDTYARRIQQYYLDGEIVTTPDFNLDFFKQIMDSITPEEITAKFRELMTEENRTIVVQGIEEENIKHLSEQEALDIINKVKAAQISPYTDAEMSSALIKEDIKGSKIIKTVPLPQFGAVEWTLGNNVKVVYRKADFEKDNIILSAFSFGGTSRIEDNLVLTSYLLPTLSSTYGAGDYDNITLMKMLSGKRVSAGVNLAETTEGFSGSATPKDFETMMQLTYLRLARPRFDKEAHNAMITRYAGMIANMEKDPNKIMSDSISMITTGYSKRTPLLTKETISGITLEDVQKIYTDRFSNADEFIFFIVGNVEQETVIPMVEKYLGALPSNGRKETWIDRKVEQPDGLIKKEIPLQLKVPKSTIVLSYEKNFKYNPKNYIGISVISAILDIVYTKEIREKEGGTYGVNVSLSAQKRPTEQADGYITFECDPARANDLKAIVYREIEKLVKEGPSQENLDKAVTNMLKTREESKKHNSYWSSALSRYYSYGINSDDPKNYEDILKAFSVKDIQKIAGKVFMKADIADLIFKPE